MFGVRLYISLFDQFLSRDELFDQKRVWQTFDSQFIRD